jgi:hypothetical protein
MHQASAENSLEGSSSASSRYAQAAKVALLLLLVAVVFSYLGAFALTNALISADLLERWPPGSDPRPRWMITSFATLTAVFTVIALWLKWTSWRHMRPVEDEL